MSDFERIREAVRPAERARGAGLLGAAFALMIIAVPAGAFGLAQLAVQRLEPCIRSDDGTAEGACTPVGAVLTAAAILTALAVAFTVAALVRRRRR